MTLHAGTKACRGVAIVEFGVGAGLLLAAFSGTFAIGYALIRYDQLVTAVAQGARYASMAPYDSQTATPSASYSSAVKNMVLYGSPVQGSAALGGLTAANVNLVISFSNGVPASVEVSLTGYTINALFQAFRLTGKPRVTYPYQGVWTPA